MCIYLITEGRQNSDTMIVTNEEIIIKKFEGFSQKGKNVRTYLLYIIIFALTNIHTHTHAHTLTHTQTYIL